MAFDGSEKLERVLVTGATGFVGRALVQRLQGLGIHVTAWTRSPERARSQLGPHTELCPVADDDAALTEALGRADAVVNLAGENIIAERWTPARKRALRESRVDLTERLVAAMRRASCQPKVLVSASAVGLYGDRGQEVITETSEPGHGFLAALCQDWEAAANAATEAGVRVVNLRIGLVIGEGGGVIGATSPLFALGLGGPLGSGRQAMPWVALDDLCDLCLFALRTPELRGPLHATAPTPTTSRGFAKAFGNALGRPAILPAPSPALRMVLGERSVALLEGQRAVPARALELGYRFRYSTIEAALDALVGARRAVQIRAVDGRDTDAPADAVYVLQTRTPLPVDADRAFEFFARAENLGYITPPFMGFQILGQSPPDAMGVGTEIRYRIKLGPTDMGWRTRIPVWQPPERFVDNQESGPYRRWWHEHALAPSAEGHGCVMTDRVYYAPPLGPLGRLAHALFIGQTLRTIFAYRQACIDRLYPDATRSGTARSAHAGEQVAAS